MTGWRKRLHVASWAQRRLQVFRRDGYRCVLCQFSGTAATLTVDHIIPLELKGKSDLSNLRTLCDPCHKSITPRWVRGVGYIQTRITDRWTDLLPNVREDQP